MRADLLNWKYRWFDLWHKEEEGEKQSRRQVDKGEHLWTGFQLCFFCFCSTAKTQSAFQFTVDWSRAASQQKSRGCHEIISVIICSIWLMWQKAAQVTVRDAQLKPYIRLLKQSPNSIFLHPIYFCAPSEFSGWLCKDVNKVFFSLSTFRVHKRIMSHCPCLSHQRVQNSEPVREHLCVYCQQM